MKKRFSGPQIVAKLRQADVLIGQTKQATPAISLPPDISVLIQYNRADKLLVGVAPCFWCFEVGRHSVWGNVRFCGVGGVVLEAVF